MQLLHGDCLELMQNIPDKSIDMILCDLPYGTTQCKWDSVIDLTLLWNQYSRIIKDNGAIALFSQPPFNAKLINSKIKWFRYEWIWEKPLCTGFLNANRMPLKAHENILIFYKHLPLYNPQKEKGKPYYYLHSHPLSSENYRQGIGGFITNNPTGERFPKDVIKIKSVATNKEKRYHPTQKPVELLEYLIKTYSNENDVILDNCMGSGSTGVACINTNRDFIGIEKDKYYFTVATERVNKAR